MVAVRGNPCLVSSCRINHLGINPERGGSPPRESRMRGVRAVRIGVFAQDVAKVFIVKEWLFLNTRNMDSVIIIYMVRAISVSLGLKWMINTIQPRCAMEE